MSKQQGRRNARWPVKSKNDEGHRGTEQTVAETEGEGSSHGKFPCTSTYFLLCHCFVATTAVTRSRRGQKALSSRKTADSDASDDGKEYTSKQLQ